ncbi:MAG: glycosyl transferase family 9 [Pseudopedobacter saltans]|uniref:Glycosyl transferase family 9 n=1 Tax=Pseudopedobacter saltans TaxID=151895 RepID=A0A2W5GXN0_9SPHI|nr:MAG: glycosyl transferase family 9 [Pseudopedobacter saltans]
MTNQLELKSILISRTDSIGDVVLTLPVAYILKQNFPHVAIGFLGKKYTQPIINTCAHIDEFLDIDNFLTNDNVTILGEKIDCILHILPKKDIAKRAKDLKIPLRIGTRNRLYHWWTCNKLIKLSRKNSELHESQLNIQLLSPLVSKLDYTLKEINQMPIMTKIDPLEENLAHLLSTSKKNVILHPKSQGNGQEWPLEYYIDLIKLLPSEHYKIFVSGVSSDKEKLQPLFNTVGDLVEDLTGRMSLSQFIAFIQKSDCLVAAGTGPLHIAAALGIHAIGIFPPVRPIHPGRWRPIGKNTTVLCSDIESKNKDGEYYIRKISPQDVANAIQQNN